MESRTVAAREGEEPGSCAKREPQTNADNNIVLKSPEEPAWKVLREFMADEYTQRECDSRQTHPGSLKIGSVGIRRVRGFRRADCYPGIGEKGAELAFCFGPVLLEIEF